MQEGWRPAARLYTIQHKQDPDWSHEIPGTVGKRKRGDEGTLEGETGWMVRLSTMKLRIILYEAGALLSGFLLSIWGNYDTSMCLTEDVARGGPLLGGWARCLGAQWLGPRMCGCWECRGATKIEVCPQGPLAAECPGPQGGRQRTPLAGW